MKKLLVVLAVLLMASPAFATIVGSKHDLSTAQGAGAEICVYCHTPHAADTTISMAPLWNRTIGTDALTHYDTPSMDNTSGSDVANSDVRLCLSCHDGTQAMNSGLVNPPNNTAAAGYGGSITSGAAYLSLDLSNDHPVGFTYVANSDTEIKLTSDTMIQCSSCHDVHNNDIAPFLIMDNTGSDLCITCHDK